MQGWEIVVGTRRRSTGLLALCIAVGGCRDGGEGPPAGPEVRDSAGVSLVTLPAEPAWGEDDGWRVTDDLVVEGVAEDVPDFGYLVDLDVDERGRIFVLDQQAQAVYAFDGDGTLAGTLGGPGDGPGELGPLAASLAVRGDTVLVGDWSQDRLTRYRRDGTFLSAEAIPGRDAARTWWSAMGGEIYLRSLRMYTDDEGRWTGDDLLLRYRAEGLVDTVLAFDYRRSDVGAPGAPNVPLFVNAPSWTLLDDGRVAWLAVLEGRVRIHDESGRLEAILEAERWRPRAPSDADVADLEEKLGDRLEMLGGSRDVLEQLPVEEPATLPGVTRVVAGPLGTLWVQRMGSIDAVHPMAMNSPDPPVGLGGHLWDVVTAEGRWLGSVEFPTRFRLMKITQDAAYGIGRNELDVDRILRLRLER